MTANLQTEDNDCGVSALVASLRLQGHQFSEPLLRDALATRGALSLQDLRDTCAAVVGVRYRGRRDFPFAELTPGTIVHLRMDHFVTVERWRGRRVRIFDPSVGYGWLTEAAYQEQASGWVLAPATPAPAANATRRPRAATRADWLWPMLRSGQIKFRQVVPVLAMSLLLYTGLTLLNMVLLPYLNEVTVAGTVAAGTLVTVLVAFSVAASALFWLRHRQLTSLGLSFDRAMLRELIDRLTRTSARTELTSGDVLHRVQSARAVREAGTGLALSLFTDAVAVVILLAFMATMSLPLTGVVAGVAALHIVLTVLGRIPINRRFEEQLQLDGELQDLLISVSRGLTTYRGLGAVRHLEAEHAQRLDRLQQSIRGLEYRLAWVYGPSNALRFAGLYVILVVGSVLLSAGLVSTGELFGFLTLGGTVLFSVTAIAQSLTNAATLERQLRYVTSVFTLPVMERGTRTEPVPAASAVVLDGVRVHRPREHFDLRLDLRVERGETVTVSGTSGVGKSTMAQIISGLDPVPTGQVTVYGVPIGDWDPDCLRPLVCYVPPRSDFLHTTIRESLSSGSTDVTDQEINDVLAAMELTEVMRPLRLGLRTRLRINGSTFSAGEVQRFALARALLRRPSLLILDEATNSLDRDLELRLLSEMQRRVETLVVISHRPIGDHLGSRHVRIVRDDSGVSRLESAAVAAVVGG
ncbi:ATP-binding cassette domain-containing protein [Verrucosispora sp. WMMD573]|uniref:ATP-binding cassette domain-containing protein n=1 Tax=Verrucosispora sp. WMMD573 TaxID=3015149 RepID=UPI00248AEB33|nr:ATP-binding cassette domain-containing protein [Verrucosispora sp. WMMD573]WBB51946.1 ATP-binding cassette domain-containing protein [Verrucosispora sp. WMMD573]